MRKRGWPTGLIERNGYYSWRHPVTRREYGIGRDKAAAFADAIEANLKLADYSKQRLVDRLTGDGDRTVGAFMDIFAKELAERDLAINTRKTYKSMAKRLVETLQPQTVLARVSTIDIADMLAGLRAEGKARAAQALRGFTVDFFRAAVAAGWISTNPALVTSSVRVKVKRARLTLDVVRQVLARCDEPWLTNAIHLALVTGQRREDIGASRFADFKDGAWWLVQKKTGTRVKIPLELRLDVMEMTLADVLKACRTTGVLSKYLIHQTRPYGNSPVGSRLHQDRITRRFSDLVLELGIDWGDREPPTFHELRSLAERLYDEQGGVNTQHLLGHLDAKSTAIYKDRRGEWMTIKVGGSEATG